ncbi:hypothetical protein Acr_23g0010010 [Actinidia rufa]|uniref:Uncharacterized protein n=1 Tax=Actinidia rufa TaxID=165716 RepID=A0A7J0GP66_9ERIC|nr:hypothetical protein Acr_23g0010010 [Actinidia rufa]
MAAAPSAAAATKVFVVEHHHHRCIEEEAVEREINIHALLQAHAHLCRGQGPRSNFAPRCGSLPSTAPTSTTVPAKPRRSVPP